MNRRGVVTLVVATLSTFLVLRGAIVVTFGGTVVHRSPVVLDVVASVAVALLACRARRVIEGRR